MAKRPSKTTDRVRKEPAGRRDADAGLSAPVEVVELDDDSENWMQQNRAEKLAAMGWKGTVGEYMEAFDKLGHDPLQDGIDGS